MSNMASCIGNFSILCMKNTDMLLFTTNIGIAYECSLYAGTWRIRSVHMLLYMLHMGTAISTVCMLQSVGFKTGNPQVGISHTIPVPMYTVTCCGYYPYRTIIHTVSDKTRSTC